MASLINPSTNFCNSKVRTGSRVSQQLRVNPLSLNLKNNQRGKVSFSVVCKAVSVKPQTDVEGLNIAEDVTQVSGFGVLRIGSFLFSWEFEWGFANFELGFFFFWGNFWFYQDGFCCCYCLCWSGEVIECSESSFWEFLIGSFFLEFCGL